MPEITNNKDWIEAFKKLPLFGIRRNTLAGLHLVSVRQNGIFHFSHSDKSLPMFEGKRYTELQNDLSEFIKNYTGMKEVTLFFTNNGNENASTPLNP